MWPLMSLPVSGNSTFRSARAAFWWYRCSGGAVAALNVSSRNVAPTPSVPPAVALPQGLHQFGVRFFLPGVQPLLELVEDDQHLFAGRNPLSPAQGRQCLFQAKVRGKGRTALPQAVQQPGFRFLGRGFEVN